LRRSPSARRRHRDDRGGDGDCSGVAELAPVAE
jgi:hypothetical protein